MVFGLFNADDEEDQANDPTRDVGPRSGIMERVSGAFMPVGMGSLVEDMDPEQAEQLRRRMTGQGLLSLGAGLLQAGAPTLDPSKSGIGVGLAQGLQNMQANQQGAMKNWLTGQSVAAKMRDLKLQQQQRENVQRFLQGAWPGSGGPGAGGQAAPQQTAGPQTAAGQALDMAGERGITGPRRSTAAVADRLQARGGQGGPAAGTPTTAAPAVTPAEGTEAARQPQTASERMAASTRTRLPGVSRYDLMAASAMEPDKAMTFIADRMKDYRKQMREGPKLQEYETMGEDGRKYTVYRQYDPRTMKMETLGRIPQGIGNVKKVEDTDSPTGWSYRSLDTGDMFKGAPPPSAMVEINQGSGLREAWSKDLSEQMGKNMQAVNESARQSSRIIPQLEQMDAAITEGGFQTGALAGPRGFLTRSLDMIGVDPSGIATLGSAASLDVIESSMKDLALTKSDMLSGNLSQKELQFILDQVPGLTMTPQGNRLLIDIWKRTAERSIQKQDMMYDYMSRPDTIGLQPNPELPADQKPEPFTRMWNKYTRENPLINEEMQNRIKAASVSPDKAKKLLPEGATNERMLLDPSNIEGLPEQWRAFGDKISQLPAGTILYEYERNGETRLGYKVPSWVRSQQNRNQQ